MFFLCGFLFGCSVAENKSNNDHTVWKLVKQTQIRIIKAGGFHNQTKMNQMKLYLECFKFSPNLEHFDLSEGFRFRRVLGVYP